MGKQADPPQAYVVIAASRNEYSSVKQTVGRALAGYDVAYTLAADIHDAITRIQSAMPHSTSPLVVATDSGLLHHVVNDSDVLERHAVQIGRKVVLISPNPNTELRFGNLAIVVRPDCPRLEDVIREAL